MKDLALRKITSEQLKIHRTFLEKLKYDPYFYFSVPSFILSFKMLIFQTTQLHLVISGNTYPIKHILKSVGGNWNAPTQTWVAPLAIDGQVFRSCLTNCCILAGKEDGAKEGGYDLLFWTERAKKMAMLSVLAKKRMGILDTDFWWICCEQCTVKNWSRQSVTCPCHRR